MKTFLKPASIFVALASAQLQALALEGDNLLTTAVRLRLQSIAPLVIDPDIIDLKLLSTPIAINAATRSAAISQLKSELEPRGLTIADRGSVVWITKREAEQDLSRQIALIINTPNYRQLANLLATEGRSNPDPRLKKLSDMANFMAEQSKLPAETRAFIDAKSKAIKNLQFNKRNALSGSSLSAPDPARAATLERDIEKHRQEVLEHYDNLIGKLLASKFDPETPSTAPPAIYAVHSLIPGVLFNRIALDSELAYVEAEEALLRASTDLAFKKADIKDTALLRARVDGINKEKLVMQDRLANYVSLLQTAGLVAGQDARATSTRTSQLGVEAANQLSNVYNDNREAVRIAIGRNIIEQLEQLAKQVSEESEEFLRHTDTKELFLLGAKEIEIANESLAPSLVSLSAYSIGSAGRIGAITGLVAGASGGKTYVITVDIEPLDRAKVKPERSLQNLFGGTEKVVSLNTSADAALVDGMLFGKSGTMATDWAQVLGSGGMVGSIADALELVKQRYDPSLFTSRIVVGEDTNYGINTGGDSAGVATALATLSRVRAHPVDARLMVTGAVRPFGEVRPVGGVYEKGVAALEAGALALLMPLSNLGSMLSLPTEKIISRNVISLSRFDEAAALAGLDIRDNSRQILEAVCLHNFAVMAAMAGKYPEALAVVQKAVALSPNHISAQMLKSVLRAGSVKPGADEPIARLFETASAFGNLLSTNPVAMSERSTDGVAAAEGTVLGAIIPDFTVTGASGNEAFEALNNKARAAFGQPANITVRSKNDYFTTKFINLSIKNKTVSEILRQICDLCDATFQQKGSAIVVDSIQTPVPTELSSIVIPDFTIQDKSAQEAFKHLADKAAEISLKPVNIVLDSKNNLFRTLSINLSMQRKTFKEILDQLCLICDATVEQRGDAFIITTPK